MATNRDLINFIQEVAVPYQGDDCLFWPFGCDGKGYGRFTMNGRRLYAHRYICTQIHGTPAPKNQAAHSCGNGHLSCVNPSHLSWKTPKANQKDRVRHGTDPRGERNGNSKLTETQAKEILRLKGIRTQREIAAAYGVTLSAVNEIHARRNWAWL